MARLRKHSLETEVSSVTAACLSRSSAEVDIGDAQPKRFQGKW